MATYRSCQGVYHAEALSEYAEEVFGWPPGHFTFSSPDADGTRYLHMVLPSSRERGSVCAIPVKQGPKTNGAWAWDGNVEKPTITPSIFHDYHSPSSDHAWHGWLKAGQFVGC
jgi:Family of unknown function (DUF6527)